MKQTYVGKKKGSREEVTGIADRKRARKPEPRWAWGVKLEFWTGFAPTEQIVLWFLSP